jgi:ACR3 family arsenite efflux pump ArsB
MSAPMSLFERYLSVWVLLCIVAGISLGYVAPSVFQTIGEAFFHGLAGLVVYSRSVCRLVASGAD